MKKKLTLGLFLGIVFSAYSQIITIKDNQTGMPLDKVVVMTENPIVSVTTNSVGQANFSQFLNLPDIEIRRSGYKSRELNYNDIAQMQFTVTMEPVFVQLDEVVVTASKWNQTGTNVVSKITTIAPKFVSLMNPQTAADMLGASGEVFIQKSQQGGGSPMIRGFSTNRLLYTVDGVRMNTAIFRSGNVQNVISLDAFAIENTEVFFGPGSVIYGSDAIGGVMSFQTLTPQFSFEKKPLITGNFVSRYASANSESTSHFDLGVGWQKWSFVSSFTHSKFESLRMGKYGPDDYLKKFIVQRVDSTDVVFENNEPRLQNPSGYSQTNLMQKVRIKPSNHWDIQYGFHYSETSEYSRYDRLIETNASGIPTSAVWNYGPQIWMMNNLNIVHTKSNLLFDAVSIKLAQQQFEESRIDRRLNHHRLRTQLEKVDAYSANIDFEKSKNKHKFYYGLEYVINNVESLGSAIDIRNGKPILVPSRYPQSTWTSYAAYLNYNWAVNSKVGIQGGLRYNGVSISSDFSSLLSFYPFDFTTTILDNTATTGSLGVIFRPQKSLKITLSGSTGFRAPNVDDMGKLFDFSQGEIVVPNTELKSEYATNGELFITKIFGNYLKLEVAGFYTYLNNAMVRRAYTVNGQDSLMYNGVLSKVFAIQNAAFATVYGFNAGFEVNLPHGFGLGLKYNYQLGNEEMNSGEVSRSRHAAPAFGIARISYTKDKITLQLYYQFSEGVSYANLYEEERQKPFIYAKDANGLPYSPSWYTLNFKGSIKVSPVITINAGIENLTDQRYRPYSSGLVAAGRNVVVSLKAML